MEQPLKRYPDILYFDYRDLFGILRILMLRSGHGAFEKYKNLRDIKEKHIMSSQIA